MKILTSKTIFLCATSSTTPHYLLSSHSLFLYSSKSRKPQYKRTGIPHFSFSSSNYYSSSSSSWRHHDDGSRNVKVSVWWDFENCNVPVGVNVLRVADRIMSALRANGIKGPVKITAFGDFLQLSRSNQEALSSTGICLNHIPNGGKNSADRSLLVDLVYWVSQNPPPAHLFLISGDRDFANILHRLRMDNYNILLASTESSPAVLCSAASIMWHWNALVRGENPIGKHFNQPPDGPHGSWYGHYKGPLEDPLLNMEQPPSLKPGISPEPGTDSKLRPVPKAVVDQIHQILNSYPKGITVTELRNELGKGNVGVNKDYYGYKRFSRLLLSMPAILKLQPVGDNGGFLVRGIHPKAAEPESNLKISTGLETNGRERDFTVTVELNGGDSPVDGDVKSSLPPPHPLKGEEPPPVKGESPPLGHKETDSCTTRGHSSPVEEQEFTSEVGFFRRMWKTWFGHKYGGSTERGNSIPSKYSNKGNSSETTKSEEKTVESRSHCAEPLGSCSSSSSNVSESILDGKLARSSEESGDKSSPSRGFFNQIVNWCRFGCTSGNFDPAIEQCNKELNQMNSHYGNHELFSNDSFWNEMESFVGTPRGSVLVSQSKTREQMAQNLQKEGPLVLNSLSANDLLRLVDLLISEKKWVEDCPSRTFPFKLIQHSRKRSSPSHPLGSKGLHSVFLGMASQSNLPTLAEHEKGEKGKRDQSHSQSGACSSKSNNKFSESSRSEILANCQKLVAEILKEYPQGFHLGCFKGLFLERYGYALDYQMLGYQKLTTLLQRIPGVKIESTYILPARKASKDSGLETALPYGLENNGTGKVSNSDSELSDTIRKDDDCDYVWEELGPVSETSSKSRDTESGLDLKTKQEMTEQVDYDDDSSFSDEEFSDSEGENPTLNGSEKQGKSRRNEEDSSLLQILDSWYSSKDDSGSKDRSRNANNLVDCSTNGSKSFVSSGIGVRSTPLVTNCGQKPKPLKKCSFVSDPHRDEKEKLIDNILGSLKKSAESRLQG